MGQGSDGHPGNRVPVFFAGDRDLLPGIDPMMTESS
jgi:hypothetical protein